MPCVQRVVRRYDPLLVADVAPLYLLVNYNGITLPLVTETIVLLIQFPLWSLCLCHQGPPWVCLGRLSFFFLLSFTNLPPSSRAIIVSVLVVVTMLDNLRTEEMSPSHFLFDHTRTFKRRRWLLVNILVVE